jgi:hypothetical protein
MLDENDMVKYGKFVRPTQKDNYISCEDCKFYVNEMWSYPYCGTQIVTTIECVNLNNYKDKKRIFEGELRQPNIINKNHNCSWFEAGNNKRNNGGRLSDKEIIEAEKSQDDFAIRASKILGKYIEPINLRNR